MYKILIIPIFLLLLFVTACETLPAGKAPDGEIVKPGSSKDTFCWQEGVNFMLTSLSMYCIQEHPQGISVSVSFAEDSSKLEYNTWKLLRNIKDTVELEIENSNKADYILSSSLKEDKIWSLRLMKSKNKKTVWFRRITIKESKK